MSNIDCKSDYGYNQAARGSGCVPVDAPVFKTGDRLRRAGDGGFDSHALPIGLDRRGSQMGKKQDVLTKIFRHCQQRGDFVFDNELVKEICREVDFKNPFDVTKIDKSELYPDVMKQGVGYFLIHLGKGSHQFVPNPSLAYHRLEPIDEGESKVWEYVPSILNDFDSSEANILSVAYNQLILHDFLYGDRKAELVLYLSRRTKFNAEYRIGSTPVSAAGIQAEMDLILVRNNDVTIIEGKNDFPDDFAIYQLFHPFLYFDNYRQNSTLDIGRIRCCYVQRKREGNMSILRMHLYRFRERNMTAIELVRKREYVLERRDPL